MERPVPRHAAGRALEALLESALEVDAPSGQVIYTMRDGLLVEYHEYG